MSLYTILCVFSFLMGAVISSFLNVVIWRVPQGKSIVSPPSHCPKCGAGIKWYQNIPIVSWLALRGKCAACKTPISPRYIFVETLGGCLFFAAFLHYGVFAPLAWVWIALMIVGSFIDFDHQLLPDFVTIGGMVWGVACSCVLWALANYASPVFADTPLAVHPFASLAGLVFGFGLLWVIRAVGTKAFKREAMGMGDVFLVGAVGAIFGPVAALVTLVVASVVGSIVGLSQIAAAKIKLGRFTEIPFGPYLCIGCLVWMFRGPQIIGWYLRLLGLRA